MRNKREPVSVRQVTIGGENPLVVIAGPCVVESRELIFQTANALKEITGRLGIPFIFKSSYRKANRTSVKGFSSIGVEESLRILEDAARECELVLLTDVHAVDEIAAAAGVADILQIPAFLSRQTDLLEAAGRSGKAVNIKKGQFLAPEEMRFAAEKVAATGNDRILLCERGTFFGYHNLVVDMRSLVVMRSFGHPVVYDATHSLQLPGISEASGGQPEYILPLARAAAAVGIDALFFETHPDPSGALSDASTQLPLEGVASFLSGVLDVLRAEPED